MFTRLRFALPALTSLATVLLASSLSSAQAQCTAGWKCGVSYGGSTVMDLFVPSKVDASPGIVVSLHYCGGNSSNARSWFQSLADKYGFIIIAPSAGGNCFDASPQRSGERAAIASMVQYVITQNHADPTKVFAAGASSGACMTNALLAAYPDVFAGGSVLAGVPAGAWTGGNAYGWTTPASRSAQEWGDLVRKADSGFSGARPRVQLWHGMGDTTLTYDPNFKAEVAQWTNVLGLTEASGTKANIKPTGAQDDWSRTSYKSSSGLVLETNSSVAGSVPHDLSGRGLWPDVVRFFGLDLDAPVGGGTGTGGAGGGGGVVGNGGTGGVGKGGSTSSGGSSNGGSPASGGSPATGGSAATGGILQGGGAPSGGVSGGGAMSAGATSGGVSSGGVSSGGTANGGSPVTGGSSSGGVSSSTGGSVTSGGQVSMGGASSGAGAPSGTGGGSTAGSSGSPPNEEGCGCRVAGNTRGGELGTLAALAAVGAFLRRRRRTQA